MKEITENITRQDVYSVVIPIVICVISWLLPLLKNADGKFTKKWMCSANKSDWDKYARYFLVVVSLGIAIYFFGAVALACINQLLIILLEIEIPLENLKTVLSIILIISYLIIMIRLKFDSEKIKIARNIKAKKIITYFMYYAPFACSIWMYGFSMLLSSKVLNGLMLLLLFACEVLAFVFLDSTKKFEYTNVVLYFSSGKEETYSTKYVRQKGNWIIAKDLEALCEVRYRREDLVQVKYFNNTETNNKDSNSGLKKPRKASGRNTRIGN